MALRRCLALLILLPLLLTFGLQPQATPAATPDAEDAAVKAVEKLGGRVAHADNDPAKPIIKVDLSTAFTDLQNTKVTNAALKVTDAGLKELAGAEGAADAEPLTSPR